MVVGEKVEASGIESQEKQFHSRKPSCSSGMHAVQLWQPSPNYYQHFNKKKKGFIKKNIIRRE
jgi:hypothetical protein